MVCFLRGLYFCKSRLLPLEKILEVKGRIMIPKVVVVCFEQKGKGGGRVGLIRHHVGRLVGIVDQTGSMKARHAAAFFKAN